MDNHRPAEVWSQRTITRRRLLQGAAAGAISLRALSLSPRWMDTFAGSTTALAAPQCSRYGAFDDHTFATLAAIGSQIIPSDGTPGASEACTTSFIELNAAGNSSLRDLLANAVAAIDQSSTILYGGAFVDLAFAQQTAVLTQLEAGTAPGTLWNSTAFRAYVTSPGQPVSAGLQNVLAALATPAGPVATVTPNMTGRTIQQVVFGTCRSLTKLAWVINWPEAFVRDPASGQPIFSDTSHLISDPDVAGTGTGWEVIRYHVISYDVETLLWAWQAGLKVTGFDHGWPTFASKPLSDKQRLAARDQLYQLSNQGLA